jgi:glutamate dehydrogenase/leucine dehydrogenase
MVARTWARDSCAQPHTVHCPYLATHKAATIEPHERSLLRHGVLLNSILRSAAGKYVEGETPWKIVEHVDVAMPCATQNEVDAADVKALVAAGMKCLTEGANMPSNSEAIEAMHEAKIEFGPAKAANAGARLVRGLVLFCSCV